jgi:hypothetical protein
VRSTISRPDPQFAVIFGYRLSVRSRPPEVAQTNLPVLDEEFAWLDVVVLYPVSPQSSQDLIPLLLPIRGQVLPGKPLPDVGHYKHALIGVNGYQRRKAEKSRQLP